MQASVYIFVIMITTAVVHSAPSGGNETFTCTVDGQDFAEGELVTGNPCDRCICTRYGIMCELYACPALSCTARVQGQCCEECAPEKQDVCLYQLPAGNTIVPYTGCRYTTTSGDKVCYCDNTHPTEPVFCLPAFPMDSTASCVIQP